MLFRIVKWVSLLIVAVIVLAQIAIIIVALVTKSDEKKAKAEDKVEIKLPVQRR